ncbi:hypothetical protein CNECB9_5450017 [Cupriavidus necator]|uniref:Uncharacterized protein n=1 Tax=Cupriavidus necator TaxID=106590 RepID=A0A1K0JKN5_CUPNE|nr:hypothetical protein CNECB9_5450017 [Cupriavidus necator]
MDAVLTLAEGIAAAPATRQLTVDLERLEVVSPAAES